MSRTRDKSCTYRVLLMGKPEGKRPLLRLVVDGKIILKWMYKTLDGEVRTEFIWLSIRRDGGLL